MRTYKILATSLLVLALSMTGCPKRHHSGGNEVIAIPDTTPPTVTGQSPSNAASDVPLNQIVSVAFSEDMDPASINDGSFTLVQGATPVIGNVVSNGTIATFTSTSSLSAGLPYTVNVSIASKDLAGNALLVASSWGFVTGSSIAAGPAAVLLGNAGNFVILAKAAVSTTGATAVTGDIGLSPAAGSYLTGFSETMDASNEFSTSSYVTGRLYAADYTPPTPSNMTTSVSDMETAFVDAAGRTLPDHTELGNGDVGGMTLPPGLYKWGTGLYIPTFVTLSGAANDVWIFQIAQDFTIANGAMMNLTGGAQAKNVFWQVSGQVIVGTTADVKGIFLCQTQIVFQTGAILLGRALAQTAVTLDANAVTKP